MIDFSKYHGTGNDFILIDNRGQQLEQQLTQAQIAQLCHRHFGIGADGLILLSDSEQVDFRMIYYNSDGGESTLCGNGSRCLIAFARRCGIIRKRYCFEASDGLHEARYLDGQVELEMALPRGFQSLSEAEVWLDTGSPHYVQQVEEAVEEVKVVARGQVIRESDAYTAIGGTNVNFVQTAGPDRLRVRTYERGVEAETLSCGTGVTACAYAHLRAHPNANQPARLITVETPGGELSVRFEAANTEQPRLWLCGPAEHVFDGEIRLPG
jgi:diaminopimelate epimerase